MYSVRELFRVGKGPSSSHTIGPGIAAKRFREKCPDAQFFKVMLFGSLGATGIGHGTDKAIAEEFAPFPVEFIWQPEVNLSFHPNAMRIEGFLTKKDKKAKYSSLYYSVGGGAIIEEGDPARPRHAYPHEFMRDILTECRNDSLDFVQYIERYEGTEVWDFLQEIWTVMDKTIDNGLTSNVQYLPAEIVVERKAPKIHKAALDETDIFVRRDCLIASYALAVSEENASGGTVSTAPTCGSAGVIPAVLRYAKEQYNLSDNEIVRALGIAGILGLLAKHNASLSGAEVGCQGEIGVSCSMAAGAMTYLLGGTIDQIERAAEVAMEHSLGMTCDPIGGYVIIPCIERNAMGALRSVTIASYAKLYSGLHKVSYDKILTTMYETGLDMQSSYKETSVDGLAKYFDKIKLEDKSLRPL
ncbi:MAG: L-serine ammonia-lyase, iron-sulfur-dependent, subunit alpha [Desulfovibrionaceae bacterium]